MMRSRRKSKEDDEENVILTEKNSSERTSTEMPKIDDIEQTASTVGFVEQPMKLMPTLPESFKSLVGCPIHLKNDDRKPQNTITSVELISRVYQLKRVLNGNLNSHSQFPDTEFFINSRCRVLRWQIYTTISRLLGNALGIDDYQTNMASFWFLDFIALQVLLFEKSIDDNEISVLVSWLAGEMKFIRENNFSHDAFLREMKNIFVKCSEKMSRGCSLLHWDLLDDESESDKINVEDDTETELKESEISQRKMTKRRFASRSRGKRNSSKDRSKQSAKTLDDVRIEDSSEIGNKEETSRSEVHSGDILDIIIEATYNMYGNSFHYALIVAAFVEPVQLHEYTLPITFRQPRPLKIFEIDKDKSKKDKTRDAVLPRKSKELKKKKTNGKKVKKNSDVESMETIEKSLTPPVLTEEEILKKKREFILPLMDANEASVILETYR